MKQVIYSKVKVEIKERGEEKNTRKKCKRGQIREYKRKEKQTRGYTE